MGDFVEKIPKYPQKTKANKSGSRMVFVSFEWSESKSIFIGRVPRP